MKVSRKPYNRTKCQQTVLRIIISITYGVPIETGFAKRQEAIDTLQFNVKINPLF